MCIYIGVVVCICTYHHTHIYIYSIYIYMYISINIAFPFPNPRTTWWHFDSPLSCQLAVVRHGWGTACWVGANWAALAVACWQTSSLTGGEPAGNQPKNHGACNLFMEILYGDIIWRYNGDITCGSNVFMRIQQDIYPLLLNMASWKIPGPNGGLNPGDMISEIIGNIINNMSVGFVWKLGPQQKIGVNRREKTE